MIKVKNETITIPADKKKYKKKLKKINCMLDFLQDWYDNNGGLYFANTNDNVLEYCLVGMKAYKNFLEEFPNVMEKEAKKKTKRS